MNFLPWTPAKFHSSPVDKILSRDSLFLIYCYSFFCVAFLLREMFYAICEEQLAANCQTCQKKKRERLQRPKNELLWMNGDVQCVIVPSLTIERKVRLHKDKLTILSEKEGTPFPVTPVESWWRKSVKAISLGNKTANANKDQPITRKMKTYPQFQNLFSSHSQYFYSMNLLSFISNPTVAL